MATVQAWKVLNTDPKGDSRLWHMCATMWEHLGLGSLQLWLSNGSLYIVMFRKLIFSGIDREKALGSSWGLIS